MITYQLTIFSKNNKSIKHFTKFFKKKLETLKLNILRKKISKKTGNKKKISILKSPHVNKKAQEQFEFTFFKNKIIIFSTKKFKTQIFFKKIKSKLFYDLKIIIKTFIDKKKNKYNPLVINNFKITKQNNFINSNKNISKIEKPIKLNYIKTVNLIKNIDFYGESGF